MLRKFRNVRKSRNVRKREKTPDTEPEPEPEPDFGNLYKKRGACSYPRLKIAFWADEIFFHHETSKAENEAQNVNEN